MEEKTLPSGATLRIGLAPFADAKRLYQAVLSELRAVALDAEREIDINLMKELFCVGFSSPAIDAALAKCMEKSLYNGIRITPDTFEAPQAREDYLHVCWEVAHANIAPFWKNLQLLSAKIGELLPKKDPPTA